jgi:hypothetical protein
MNQITIDSTQAKSDLCILCSEAGTDKSPFTVNGHRHPYTLPYSLLLEPLRHKPIKFAEIGVFRGASLKAWRNYFTEARIFGYDNDMPNLNYIFSMGLPNVFLAHMDAGNEESIATGLGGYCQDNELFDVILDDASHSPSDQCAVIKVGLHFLKKGGILIVEDIFRERSIEPYEKIFEEVKHLVSFHTFITCDHALRYSPGWNNDKLLVFVKN